MFGLVVSSWYATHLQAARSAAKLHKIYFPEPRQMQAALHSVIVPSVLLAPEQELSSMCPLVGRNLVLAASFLLNVSVPRSHGLCPSKWISNAQDRKHNAETPWLHVADMQRCSFCIQTETTR